jgi:hypothetical protein
MDRMARRIAARWIRKGLKIDQRRGEYPTSFWREVTLALCKKLGVNPSPVVVQFRKRMKEHGGGIGACAGSTVVIDPAWILQTQMATLAHELRHAYQHQSGMLQCGKNDDGEFGQVWEGEWYSERGIPWARRPWEIDANKYNRVGDELFKRMESRGEIPLSKTERVRQGLPFQGPTMGDLTKVLSDEEFDEELRHRKRDQDGWLEVWRERYRTGWRGLKITPAVGKVGSEGDKLYLFAKLTPESRARLLVAFPPVHEDVEADHMTVWYDPPADKLEALGSLVGQRVELRVVGVATCP